MRWHFQFVGPNNKSPIVFLRFALLTGAAHWISSTAAPRSEILVAAMGERGNADNERGSARQHSIT